MIETRYDGPTTTTSLTFPGRSIRIVRPAEPDRLLDDPDVDSLSRSDDYMPYWAYLWPGAFLLAEAVAREEGLEGREVLEIGCGLGLAGLVAMTRGNCVCFTDYDETPLRFVARSVEANGFDPAACRLERMDWRQAPETKYPVILGADVLYERRLVPLVVGVLERMLAPDGVALVAGPYRVATEDLGQQLEDAGFSDETLALVARDDAGRSVRGTLHRIRHA